MYIIIQVPMAMAKFVTYLQKRYENNHGISKTLHIKKQNNQCTVTIPITPQHMVHVV
jgi:hypothetical protein